VPADASTGSAGGGVGKRSSLLHRPSSASSFWEGSSSGSFCGSTLSPKETLSEGGGEARVLLVIAGFCRTAAYDDGSMPSVEMETEISSLDRGGCCDRRENG